MIDHWDKLYNINSFQTIGWNDPFPRDELLVLGSIKDHKGLRKPQNAYDLVYERRRYTPECSPQCIYIPKKEIMLKLMRSCVGVEKPQDLWIFHY
jgi:hypothetical protein